MFWFFGRESREIEGLKMSFGTILTMAGGLGLFLFGMELMSDSIEKVAGARLRRILEIFTTNRFMGMIVGIIFTGIIQSSSACTVMVVSFVNSGLMNLYQAAGVILGANIGTTITSQLVSFNLSKIAPLILLVGVVVMMFTKKEKVRKVAEVVVGFGILFVGLSTMSQAMANMKNEPQVVNLLMSLKNPFLATLMGFALTAIIQSSSVTVSIVLLLANQDLLPLPITLYIILGCNIGACATAMLASMTGKKDAKRAALIHLLFNIIGTVIIYIALFVAGDQIVELIKSISADNGRFVANALADLVAGILKDGVSHTIFVHHVVGDGHGISRLHGKARLLRTGIIDTLLQCFIIPPGSEGASPAKMIEHGCSAITRLAEITFLSTSDIICKRIKTYILKP